MTIDKIYGGKGIGPLDPVKRSRDSESPKTRENGGVSDRIEFSSVLQEVSKAKGAAPSPATERTQKVAALKAQIAEGNYRPDLQKVAASLLKFIAEEK